MSKFINWSEVSRSLKCERSAITSKYDGKMYKAPVTTIKELEDLIELTINLFNESREPKGLNEAIQETDIMKLDETIKEVME